MAFVDNAGWGANPLPEPATRDIQRLLEHQLDFSRRPERFALLLASERVAAAGGQQLLDAGIPGDDERLGRLGPHLGFWAVRDVNHHRRCLKGLRQGIDKARKVRRG